VLDIKTTAIYSRKHGYGRTGGSATVKKLAILSLSLAAPLLLLSGCLTGTVVHDAQHPHQNDVAPWANYILLPITVPADVATSPMQLMAYLAYAQGDRPNKGLKPLPLPVLRASTNAVFWTNAIASTNLDTPPPSWPSTNPIEDNTGMQSATTNR
jgi:hypothetical protein